MGNSVITPWRPEAKELLKRSGEKKEGFGEGL